MQNTDALLRLLDHCTTRLVVNGGTATGTGFFVAPGYLLTCAHVVVSANRDRNAIVAAWNGQNYPATIEHITDKVYPDLALLKAEGISNHPCVHLYNDVLF